MVTLSFNCCFDKHFRSNPTSHILGTILGITNGFGNIPGWLAPLTAGAFTQGSVDIFNILLIKLFNNLCATIK